MSRHTLPRAFYVPKGSVKVADRHSSAVAHIYTDARGRPCAVAFAGKAEKPAFRYYFGSEAAREKRVRDYFAAVAAHERARAERRTARRAWENPYKVGDVFSTCWGYEQTNREYYEVVDVRGKHLIVREIACGYVETQWLAGKSVPLPGQYIGDPARVLAQPGGFRCPKYKHWASFDEPTVIAGVRTYDAQHVSSYH